MSEVADYQTGDVVGDIAAGGGGGGVDVAASDVSSSGSYIYFEVYHYCSAAVRPHC